MRCIDHLGETIPERPVTYGHGPAAADQMIAWLEKRSGAGWFYAQGGNLYFGAPAMRQPSSSGWSGRFTPEKVPPCEGIDFCEPCGDPRGLRTFASKGGDDANLGHEQGREAQDFQGAGAKPVQGASRVQILADGQLIQLHGGHPGKAQGNEADHGSVRCAHLEIERQGRNARGQIA